MLRNFVGTLSMAISSVGSSGATDDHWRSRFESEAPPAWHQYQMRNQFAQGQVLGEKTHTVYKKNEICRSVQITTVASGASELFAENASYSFHLKKASADKDWLLVSIVMKFDGESDSGGLIQTRLEMYSTLSDEAIRLDPDHKYLYDLVSSPRSKLQGVSPRTVNNATLVEVRFLVDPDPSDKRLLTDFTLLLDPSRNWIPLTTSAKVRNRAGVGTHTNEFTYAPGVFPLLQRSLNGQEYDLIGQTEKWKSVADETWDFQVPPRLPKDEEFMLSTYGLPEPVGLAKRKANPIYIWFIACACLFVGIAVCLRYLTYMRERRLRSPHKAQS